jgi:C-terminal processing protease CtpA/Prc
LRLIVQPIGAGFELCARLGLLMVTLEVRGFPRFRGPRIVHAVLEDSPCARVGIAQRDIIGSINGRPWEQVRYLNFGDRRPSEVTLETFVARYFKITKIAVRVPPEPYRPLDEVADEAAKTIAARPTPDTTPYIRPPRFDAEEMREIKARLKRMARYR